MFKTFGIMTKAQRENDRRVVAAYEAIVAAARQPFFYADAGVTDSPLGRFEMISLHMAILLNTGRDGDAERRTFLLELTEEFFRDVDHALRELGIGDTGVPKRMKKLASMFYGRADALRVPLETGDRAKLAGILARNVWPDAPDNHGPGAVALAGYAIEAASALEGQLGTDGLLAGKLVFPVAGKAGA